MLIYICCCSGNSSSYFCSKIKTVAHGEDVYIDEILSIVKDFEQLNKKYSLILAYGPVSFMESFSRTEYRLNRLIDQVWICPQVRYMKNKLDDILVPYSVPVSVLSMKTFGSMDATKALSDIYNMIDDE